MSQFSAYHDYLESGRYARDYDWFPTIQVVTVSRAAEERTARGARDAAAGRAAALPLLITSDGGFVGAEQPRQPSGVDMERSIERRAAMLVPSDFVAEKHQRSANSVGTYRSEDPVVASGILLCSQTRSYL